MADAEQKAMQLMAEAEKKLSSSKGFLSSLLGGGGSKVDEAIELYLQAANKFKMAKQWGKAGGAFTEAATHYQKQDSKLDAATNFVEAGNCYKKSDPHQAVSSLMKAIEIYTDMGKFTMAAKHHQTIAEIYETEIADTEKAIQHYEQASDYFRGEENNSSANKCQLKVAMFAAELENYKKAINIYEQVGDNALASSLLKYSAKEYFFRACVCHLCYDVTDAESALKRYEEKYPAFQDSRECKLIKTLLGHLEESNVDGFTEAVSEYDSISRLDQWYTKLLLRVKKSIAADDLC
ncbi:Tetratricopeptide-like helical domain [Trinorchestia longiramus]|nr:Tetratricopeptide-like helical domain [Trinorchestia longiramus]